MEIDVIAVQSHRNGVSGDGFYTVRFRCPKIENEYEPKLNGEFLAIMPEAYLNSKSSSDVECYVVFLPNTELCWRGDDFASCVADAIREYNDARFIIRN